MNETNWLATAPSQIDPYVDAVKQDVQVLEKVYKASALYIVRIGLRLIWIKNQVKHGEFKAILESGDWAASERSLQNYMSVAGTCMRDLQLKDKDCLALCAGVQEGDVLSPVSASAKIEKKLLGWVNDRTLTEIYKSLQTKESRRQKITPPGGIGPLTPEMQEEGYMEREKAFAAWFGDGGIVTMLDNHGLKDNSWAFLADSDLERISHTLLDIRKAIEDVLKQKRRAKASGSGTIQEAEVIS